ncbi:MAG: FAD-dependent oxidoreductase [Nevskiaceae bacterium]|nr:MAG: FAD-dependent oxidoreductase [Nevskiaceae bacterium]TBR73469.1 MAG: FAD-dependent oxidoreductase [Nevskiaceae bacterium]
MPTTYDVKLIQKREIAENTLEFIIEKPKGFQYAAGQFGDLVLPASCGLGEKDKHGFSYASAPYEDRLAMATRMRATSAWKNAMRKVPDGSMIQMLALWGKFTLPETTSTPVVFITGGIGITPVRGIVAQATHDRTAHKMTLLYANRTPAQAAYVEDFKHFAAQNRNFTYTLVNTGTEGRIDAAKIRAHVPDVKAPLYYLCGPEGMVNGMRELLSGLGVDKTRIKTEKFEGY